RHISSLRFDDTGHDDLAAIRAAIASSPRHVQLRLTAVGQPLPLDSGLNWAGLLSILSLLMTVVLWARQPPGLCCRRSRASPPGTPQTDPPPSGQGPGPSSH
ncbi:MAG: hypothetical protein ACR2JG_05345, partial [Geodermatophilaceae bacterium]